MLLFENAFLRPNAAIQGVKAALSLQGSNAEEDKTRLAHRAAQKLVQVALQRGTADNVTALVMLPQWSQQSN